MAATTVQSAGVAENRWLLLGVLFAARTAIAFQFQSVPAIGPYLVDTLALDFSVLGALIGAYMLPGILLAIPGGMLDRRFGSRRVMLASLAAMCLGSLLMLGGSTAMLFGGRILSGAGAVALNVVLARVVSERFPANEMVAVMGGFVASWPFGIALALVLLPSLAGHAGWTSGILVGALPSAVSFAVIFGLFRDRDGRAAEAATTPVERSAIALAATSGLVWGLYNACFVIIVANLPEFLIIRGHSLPTAAAITSIIGWVLIVTLPGGGYLTQRLGLPVRTIALSLLSVAAVTGLLVATDDTLWWVSVLALIFGIPAGLIMALPAQALAPEQRHLGMGIFFTAFYVCMAVLPGIAGSVREATDTAAAAILFGAATPILAILALFGFVVLRERTRPDGDPRDGVRSAAGGGGPAVRS